MEEKIYKIILISLVIFFTICSKSWALPECDGSPKVYKEGGNPEWDNCTGTLIWDGVSVTGKFIKGVLHYATFTFANGDKYVGELKKQENLEKLEAVSSPYESIPNGKYKGNLFQDSYGITSCLPARVNSIRVTDEYIIFSMLDTQLGSPLRYKVDKKGPQGQKFYWLRGSTFTVNLKLKSIDAIIMTLGGQCYTEPAIFTNVQFLED